MKPFVALAASAPFLLLAGIGHAASFTFSDPNCSGFTMTNGEVTCASTAPQDPVPQDPVPQDPVPQDPVPQDPVPVGGACPSTYQIPANTTIVSINGKDPLSKIVFDQSFDAPGNKIDSRSDAGTIKAWEFDNNAFQSGKITGTHGNYGQGIKDWSISACPGDFSTSLPAACRRVAFTDVTIYYDASDAKRCVIPAGQKMYLNVRANDSSQSVGYVVGNVPSATLQ